MDEAARRKWLEQEKQAVAELTKALEAQLRLVLAEEAANAMAGLEAGTPKVQAALLSTLQDAAGLGVDAALDQLAGVAMGVDWTLPHQAARDWARQYHYGLIRDVNQTSIDVLRKELDQWAVSGEHFNRLKESLAPYFGDRRARLIAMTETTRAYAEGNVAAWRAGGLADRAPEQSPPLHPGCRCGLSIEEQADGSWAYIWNAANDERMCPDCSDRNNRPVGLAKAAPERPPEERQPWEGMAGQAPEGEDVTSDMLDEYLWQGLEKEDWYHADDAMRSQAKAEIVRELSTRTGLDGAKVNDLIHQWAMSSNDEDMRSLAIQRDAAELFGVPLSEFTKQKIIGIERQIAGYQQLHPGLQGLRPDWTSLLATAEQKLSLREMYAYTQERLAAAGFKPGSTVRLVRGVTLPASEVETWRVGDTVSIIGNSLESWSLGTTVAERFANFPTVGQFGVVFEMDVPVELVVGSARSGFGCLSEGEFVTLGAIPGKAKVMKVVK